MKESIVLVGGGGHCKSVLDTIQREHKYDEICVLDPEHKVGDKILEFASVLGNDDMMEPIYSRWIKNQITPCAHIAIGGIRSLQNRRLIVEKNKHIGFLYPQIIDNSAEISRFSYIGDGCFIGKGSIINANVEIGMHVIINTGSIIEHDCRIGDYSHISVGTIICGNVEVGNEVFVGAGATVVQGIRIADGAIIGAGSVVLRNVKPNETVMGIVK